MSAPGRVAREPARRPTPVMRRAPRSRPLVLELVGPAAAGKTSLITALAGSRPDLRAGLRVPRHRHLVTALGLAPTYLALHLPYDAFHWKAIKRITYLGTLHRLVGEPASVGAGTVILDEGAVYMLARLQVHGAERIRSTAYSRWWHRAIEAWAGTLDLIVWLDAPDRVLRDRLRERGQSHPAKHLSDEALSCFLARWRDAYWRVISALTVRDGPRVLTVRTDEKCVADIVVRVLAETRMMDRVDP